MTLEMTLAQRGITLPAWNAESPASVSAWEQASLAFAQGARGNVTVLQGDVLRVDSMWGNTEYPALISNPNVSSITAVDPQTGATNVIWTRS
jgi:filamentous hemagglutinin